MSTALSRRSAQVLAMALFFATMAGAFGAGYAKADVRAILKAPKTIQLGQSAKLKIRVGGIPNSQLKSATYRVEAAPFPYKSWESTGPDRSVKRHNIDVQVDPRSNTAFRVVVDVDGKTGTSSAVRIYVEGSTRSILNFHGWSVTAGIIQKSDASFGAKWSRVPRRDKYLYVFEACGNHARPTTNYHIKAKLPVRARSSHETTVLSTRRVLRSECRDRGFSAFWIVTYFGASVNLPLKDGDDGFGAPTVNRKQIMRKQRLKLRKTLTARQALSLLKGL